MTLAVLRFRRDGKGSRKKRSSFLNDRTIKPNASYFLKICLECSETKRICKNIPWSFCKSIYIYICVKKTCIKSICLLTAGGGVQVLSGRVRWECNFFYVLPLTKSALFENTTFVIRYDITRPVNLLPLERYVINTQFILTTRDNLQVTSNSF